MTAVVMRIAGSRNQWSMCVISQKLHDNTQRSKRHIRWKGPSLTWTKTRPQERLEQPQVGRCHIPGPRRNSALGSLRKISPNPPSEPVSVRVEPVCGHAKMEIEKLRAETGAANAPKSGTGFRGLSGRD